MESVKIIAVVLDRDPGGSMGGLVIAQKSAARIYEGMELVNRRDFDLVTAEREALQLLLNNRVDDQLTSLEQRRYAEQQAREAAERRVEELAGILEEALGSVYAEAGRAESNFAFKNATALAGRIEAALNPTAEAVSYEP